MTRTPPRKPAYARASCCAVSCRQRPRQAILAAAARLRSLVANLRSPRLRRQAAKTGEK